METNSRNQDGFLWIPAKPYAPVICGLITVEATPGKQPGKQPDNQVKNQVKN